MKSVIVVVLCSLVAYANAFTSYSSPSSIVGVGKAIPRLSLTTNSPPQQAVTRQFRGKDETSTTTALANMLREYANYNDVWDGDYGYGGYGMGRGVYSRRGYG
jgi:hypothetical protein